MTSTVKVLIPSQVVPAAQTTLYTSPPGGKGTWIDVARSLNYSAAAATLSVNLVTAADTAGNQNLSIKASSLAAGASYACPEITGRFLGPGDFISVLAGTTTSLNISIAGRELT